MWPWAAGDQRLEKQVAAAHATPAGTPTEQHCGMAEPGSAAKG
ncbi:MULTISPECIES: hypothetical protein [unclassified Mesorhizobium]|nr:MULTISPECIES: hypothetical protein [unclassified Mesorhizobium]ESY00503.1 hypothetical protein X755_07815 [Mesorhizobium sp. LNJC405B00]ESZ34961.1 hypothetical protein X733_08570 [Mesorhizobium sp. L2C067A000]ESZ50909.1 hypothetical protein X730_08985 [Mesorhizobium sp. L103C565B0]